MFKKCAFLAAIVCAIASTSDAFPRNSILQVGTNERLNVQVIAGVNRADTITYPGAKYISVRFSSFNLPPGDEVVVRSPDSQVLYRYTGKGRNDAGSFIASYIPGDKAIVEYTSTNKDVVNTDTVYTIPGFARGFSTRGTQSICGTDQSIPAKCFTSGSPFHDLPLAYEKSRAVARLLLNGTNLCTGWLAGSEGHMITNRHCIKEPEMALVTDIEFGGESASCADECKVELGCKGKVVTTTSTFVTNDQTLDYAVVKLPSAVDLTPYGYLQVRGAGPQLGEEIYIPQHPVGWAKRIAYTHDDGKKTVIQSLHSKQSCGENQVGYMVDTQGGSSGSPVLATTDNLVVSLHHCGGCQNQGVDTLDVLADLKKKGIVIKDLVVGPVQTPAPIVPASASAPAPTQPPAPTQAPTPPPTTAKPTPLPTPKPTAAPTPAPTKARGFCGKWEDKASCYLWFWCKWESTSKTCIKRF